MRPTRPCVLGRNSVALAIGSFLVNCHKCSNICFSNCFCISLLIGKTLVRNVTLGNIREFKSMAFPLKDRCLLENCCICVSIFF